MNYRLIKSEPYKYSWEQFLKDGITKRDGVRNYQARNNLNAMRVWDQCFWYHSNEGKEIVGIAQVSRETYPDPTSDNPTRVCMDVVPYHTFIYPITLEYIKTDPKLARMVLLKQQRLSVAPVTEEEFEYIKNLWK